MRAQYSDRVCARFGASCKSDRLDQVAENGALHRILSRRTHRRYRAESLPENLIELITAAALSASSKSDFQQVSIVRVLDRTKRGALAALVPSMPWIDAAPLFLVFCGDARRLERIGELRGRPQPNCGLEGFFNATVDAALVLQTFVLAAEAAGLGCCPISALRNHADKVAEILGLPDRVFPVAGLCVGYPESDSRISMRLPPAVTVHRDHYDDSRLATLIDIYDRERDASHPIAADKHRDPKRFGAVEFYGWSEDKARQALAPEGQTFPAFLRRSGFSFD